MASGLMLLQGIAAACGASVPRVVIVGGTGRIGSAVAAHLVTAVQGAELDIVLAGRDATRGTAAVAEICAEVRGCSSTIRYEALDFRDAAALASSLDGAAAVIHTAGPYSGESPEVLAAAIAARTPVYVDLSDPVAYLDAAVAMDADARSAGTLALCAAGAFPCAERARTPEPGPAWLLPSGDQPAGCCSLSFPAFDLTRCSGLSNVLAMECAARLRGKPLRDVDFSYFTAGLGGSGDINLYITNEGFGEPVPVFRDGGFRPQMDAGSGARKVNFFTADVGESFERIGERTVWNWPFPEAKTVAERLDISGASSVGMGTR